MIRNNLAPHITRAKTNRFGTALALGLIVLGLGASVAAPRAFIIAKTPESSAEFNFRVTLIPVPGTVKGIEAQLRFDPNDLSKVSGSVSVDLTKLETGIGLRDQHAKNALGVELQPKAVFTINNLTGLKVLAQGIKSKATVNGTFSLHGVKHSLQAPVTLMYDGTQVAVEAMLEIALSDYKISVVGADPKVDVTVKFSLTPGSSN
jgi:polyisoprenoid-binding protein YceI